MDIYRFFHPQHNPRLLGTPLRQQELGELEQAAAELLRAVKRACQRTVKNQVGGINPSDFANLMEALQYSTATLAKICDKHPGDSVEDLEDLIIERSDLPAWSNWARLVSEQIALGGSLADSRLILEKQSAVSNNSVNSSALKKDFKTQNDSQDTSNNPDPHAANTVVSDIKSAGVESDYKHIQRSAKDINISSKKIKQAKGSENSEIAA